MFEGLVSQYINQYLGAYIDQVEAKQLSIGILTGTRVHSGARALVR